MPEEHEKKPKPLTDLERAEKRRRIAEIRWNRAQLQHEAETLTSELKADRAANPR